VANGHRTGPNKNNVSATVSIREHEWEEVREWMWENRNFYSGISVLPYNDHTYKQTPFEDISKEMYDKLSSSLYEINLNEIIEENDDTDLQGEISCGGNSCEIK
jgi:hypothetical protein